VGDAAAEGVDADAGDQGGLLQREPFRWGLVPGWERGVGGHAGPDPRRGVGI